MICKELNKMREEELLKDVLITKSYLDDWSNRINNHLMKCKNCQPERLNPEACDHSGMNIMQQLNDKSQKCCKCDSIFTRCDSLNIANK